jgi:hypothetical protein
VTPRGIVQTTLKKIVLTGENERSSTGGVDPVWGCLNNPSRLG